jgi:hypothetical protein
VANEYGDYLDSGANADTVWLKGGGPIKLETGTVSGGGGFSSGGPSIIADGPHVAVGIVSVSVNSAGNLVVTTDGSFTPICRVWAQPDETLAARGISCGPSVGTTTTVISFSKADVQLDLTTQAGWDAVSGSSANIWVGWESPVYRGVGDPSKADQALALIAALDARLATVEAALESL